MFGERRNFLVTLDSRKHN